MIIYTVSYIKKDDSEYTEHFASIKKAQSFHDEAKKSLKENRGEYKTVSDIGELNIELNRQDMLDFLNHYCNRSAGLIEVIEMLTASEALIAWLNDTGKTNKSRRGRVPEKLLTRLEQTTEKLRAQV